MPAAVSVTHHGLGDAYKHRRSHFESCGFLLLITLHLLHCVKVSKPSHHFGALASALVFVGTSVLHL